MSTALETGTLELHQTAVVTEVRAEFPKYFEALDKPARALVGEQVPSLSGEGMVTLRDTNEVRDWQEHLKHLLTSEVRDRLGRRMEESSEVLQTVHASIELFQNNPDLVPGTKQFDRELADTFVRMAKPYELRVEGKLQGYTIPVQPLVAQVRSQLVASRAAATAAAAAPAGAGAPAKPNPAPAAAAPAPGPQSGIPAKAGSTGEHDDFSTLFGTIGLPTLRI